MVPEGIKTTTPASSKRRFGFKNIAIGCLGLLALLLIGLAVLYLTGYFAGTHQKVDVEPAFSPDGSRIAFTSLRQGNRDIFVVNADGSNLRQLTSNPLAFFSLWNNYSDMSADWSPDGKQIVFASARNNTKMSYTAFDIYVMDGNGSNVKKWWVSDWLDSDSIDYHPGWSPDGKRIVFCSDGNGSDRNIYVAAVEQDSSSLQSWTQFTGSNVDYPSWSPDGSKISFAMNFYDSDVHNIFVINPGGKAKYLAIGSHPTWSPDGQRIAFSRTGRTNTDIYVINADGSGESQLTMNAGDNTSPDWAPDGSKIVFSSSRNGDTLLYLMNADGSNVVQLTH